MVIGCLLWVCLGLGVCYCGLMLFCFVVCLLYGFGLVIGSTCSAAYVGVVYFFIWFDV